VEIRRGGRGGRGEREREREREEVYMPTGCSRIKRPPPGGRFIRGRGNVKETERKNEKKRDIWENEKIEE